MVNWLIPICAVDPRSDPDICFNSSHIRIGAIISYSNPLSHFSPFYFPYPYASNSKEVPKVLLSIYPNLQRLITNNWFISLRSFSFQWRVDTLGDNKTLTTLAKIFAHTSRLPNLRIFAWSVDCDFKEVEKPKPEEKSPSNHQENELPIFKDMVLSNSNLFPSVETMKISFYGAYGTFVSLPLLFFDAYLSNTNCLTELQLQIEGTKDG